MYVSFCSNMEIKQFSPLLQSSTITTTSQSTSQHPPPPPHQHMPHNKYPKLYHSSENTANKKRVTFQLQPQDSPSGDSVGDGFNSRGGVTNNNPSIYHYHKQLKQQTRHHISSISFGIKSPADILAQSECEIKENTIYNKNIPRFEAMNDSRLGTVDRRIPCATCGHHVEKCPGHTGHINLAVPLYNMGFFDYVFKILKSVCYFCSSLLIPREDLNMDEHLMMPNGQKFEAITTLTKDHKYKECYRCKGTMPFYKRKNLSIERTWPEGTQFETEEEKKLATRFFHAGLAREILEFITDEDCQLMGFDVRRTRPEYLITTVLLVPPPTIRPAISMTEGSKARGQDDLTRKLQDVLKRSNNFRRITEKINLNELYEGVNITPEVEKTIFRELNDLQYDYSVYLNNELKGVVPDTQRSGVPIRGITQRIKSKEGLIRNNLNGKRVDYSGRTVISADATIDVDEVGLPLSFVTVLTKPVYVTPFTIEELSQRVKIGPGHYTGAAMVEYSNGKTIQLSACPDRHLLPLPMGTKVHRYLKDGDYVILNRQPSLHKSSLMAHRVKIIKEGDTIRVNLVATKPYNADFDGDEMNVHVVLNVEAEAELSEIMAVHHQIMGAQSSRPIMGLVQDALTGVYLMTRRNTFLTREQVMTLLMCIKYPVPGKPQWELPVPAIIKPQPLWTGKQIVSLLLPRITLEKRVRGADGSVNDHDDKERVVIIQQGELLAGALCKATIGSSSGGIIHVMNLDYSGQITCNFLSDIQRVVNCWNMGVGFSIGLSDCIITEEQRGTITKRIRKTMSKVDKIYQQISKISNLPKDAAEGPVYRVVSEVLNHVGSVVTENLSDDNHIYCTITSGSKGSAINAAQITGSVGQQSVEGRPIAPKKSGRTLSAFSPWSTDPRSRGLVTSSYVKGLNPTEFFMHGMGGREGLVDTAVKTSDTGYMQRRMVKAMEALKISYDQSVRDAQNVIVDFCYGSDGLDAACLEAKIKLDFLLLNSQGLLKWCGWNNHSSDNNNDNNNTNNTSDNNDNNNNTEKDEWQNLCQLREECLRAKITTLNPVLDPSTFLPINIPRIVKHVKKEEETKEYYVHHQNQSSLSSLPSSSSSLPTSPSLPSSLFLYHLPTLPFYINNNDVNAITIHLDVCRQFLIEFRTTIMSHSPLSFYPLEKTQCLEKLQTFAVTMTNHLEKTYYTDDFEIRRKLIECTSLMLRICIILGSMEAAIHLGTFYKDVIKNPDMALKYYEIAEHMQDQNNTGSDYLFTYLHSLKNEVKDMEKPKSPSFVSQTRNLELEQLRHEMLAEVQYHHQYHYFKSNNKHKDKDKIQKQPTTTTTVTNPTTIVTNPTTTPTTTTVTNPTTTTTTTAINPTTILTPAQIFADVKSLVDQVGQHSLFLRAYIYSELTSHNVLHKFKLDEKEWNLVKEIIIQKCTRSVIQPGEMVGALSAESVGEGNTQGTLNSVVADEWIILRSFPTTTATTTTSTSTTSTPATSTSTTTTPPCQIVQIGPWIDNLLHHHQQHVQFIAENRTDFLDLTRISLPDLHVTSVDEDGKSSLQRVTGITRHLPVGNLIRIVTRSGQSVTAARQKSFLIWNEDEQKFRVKHGDELKIGDSVPTVISNLAYQNHLLTRIVSTSDPSFYIPLTWATGYSLAVLSQWGNVVDHDDGKVLNITIVRPCPFISIGNSSSIDLPPHYQKFVQGIHVMSPLFSVDMMSLDTLTVTAPSLLVWLHDLGIHVFPWTFIPESFFCAPRKFIQGFIEGLKDHNREQYCSLHEPFYLPSDQKQYYGDFNTTATTTITTTAFTATTTATTTTSTTTANTTPPITASSTSTPTSTTTNPPTQLVLHGHHNTLLVKQIVEMGTMIGTSLWQQFNPTTNLHSVFIHPPPHPQIPTHHQTMLDPILHIEEVIPHEDQYVYDLSVEQTLNFCLLGGLGISDTFHYSGVAAKNVTLGVPRLKELLDVAKNMKIPSLTIALRPFLNQNEQAITAFAKSLEKTCLEDVVTEADVIWDPELCSTTIAQDEEMITNAAVFFQHLQDHEKSHHHSSWVIRIKLHKHLLLSKNYTSLHVVDAIQSFIGEEGLLWFTPPEDDQWIVRVRLANVKEMIDGLEQGQGKQLERNLTYSLQSFLMSNVVIGGVKEIEKATPRKIECTKMDKQTGNVETSHEWVIDTEGSCFRNIGVLPSIDWNKTYSNNVTEVCEVLGIEAASQILFDEIKHVLSFDGSSVNDRHIMMIVNTMTYRGNLTPFNRFGFNRQDDGSVLGRASFEEPMEILLEGAAFGHFDPLRGVSERIIVGRKANIGTNSFQCKNIVKERNNGGEKDGIEDKNLAMNLKPWRTRVTASWIPWEKRRTKSNATTNVTVKKSSSSLTSSSSSSTSTSSLSGSERKFDSPPPSPLLKSLMANVSAINNSTDNNTINTTTNTFNSTTSDATNTDPQSPTPLPPDSTQQSFHSFYYSDKYYIPSDTNSSSSSTVYPQYRPSSPDINDPYSFPVFRPLYRPSSPDLTQDNIHMNNFHNDLHNNNHNNPNNIQSTLLSSEEISSLLDSLVKTNMFHPGDTTSTSSLSTSTSTSSLSTSTSTSSLSTSTSTIPPLPSPLLPSPLLPSSSTTSSSTTSSSTTSSSTTSSVPVYLDNLMKNLDDYFLQ